MKPITAGVLLMGALSAKDLASPVQFRIKNTRHTYLIENIQDSGPKAIEVPLVEDEAVVDEVLDAFYYHQVGHRSCWIS